MRFVQNCVGRFSGLLLIVGLKSCLAPTMSKRGAQYSIYISPRNNEISNSNVFAQNIARTIYSFIHTRFLQD